MAKRSVAVQIAGQEYRIKSDADEAWLQRVAGHVDDTMGRVRERTGTVDSLDVAVLTALNMARELLELQEGKDASSVAPDRLRDLIDLAETSLANTSEASG